MTVYLYGTCYWFKDGRLSLKLFEKWLTNDIKVMVLKDTYKFNKNHKFEDLAEHEVKDDCYLKGGLSLWNKTLVKSQDGSVKYDADDVAWGHGTFKSRSAALYNKTDKKSLIGWIDFNAEASVVNGMLTIVWNKKGVLHESLFY